MARAMKNSGVPWIGEIPEGWEVSLIGRDVKEVHNINVDCSVSNALQFHMGSIIPKSRGNSKYTPETLAAYNVVEKGDIMINGLNLSFDFISQRVGQVQERGVITSAYLAVRPNSSFSSDYLTYLFKSYDNCKALHSMGKGLRQTLNYKEFRNYNAIMPPLSEQRAIAEYLNRKCSEVDVVVALQEQMIAELKAYKQSVITEAVTKGLNPNVPMRDSGIDWIGEIPEHWEVVKLSLLTTKIGSGSTPTGGANVYVSEGVKFLRSQNVYFEGFDLTDVAHITDEIDEEMKGTRVNSGDVLLNITGGSIGRCYFVDNTLGRANVNQHVSIIRPSRIATKYLKYYLQSEMGQNQITMLQTGGNREGLSAAALSKFKIVRPSVIEQQKIADFLDTKCADIDRLITLKQEKIDSLKEYKKSLIYEYVTGKKQVN